MFLCITLFVVTTIRRSIRIIIIVHVHLQKVTLMLSQLWTHPKKSLTVKDSRDGDNHNHVQMCF